MRIILASQSPRRKFLLRQMGLKFDVIPSRFEEYFDDNRPVTEVVKELALGKALDVAKNYPAAAVIGSDLIVVIDGKQIGKPQDPAEAKQMLRNISGRSHQLICSVAVVCLDKNYKKVLTDEAQVTLGKLPEGFIEQYVATGSTYDKACGYAILHPLVRPHVLKIEGRLDTIIGLPTNLLAEMLNDFGMRLGALNLENLSSKAPKELFE